MMGTYRILVADDEPIERQVINKKLSTFFPGQVEIFLAENGLQAVEVFAKKNCQIAILDIAMPGMNGLEAASVIRERSEGACIIFLTAFDEFSYAKKAIEIRALDYLLKPGSDDDLINVLEEAFGICDSRSLDTPLPDSTKEPSVVDEGPEEGEDNEPSPNDFVKIVRDYIESHFQEDIALQDIAGVFGYSDVYFCKLFKQNFGMNFITFLNEFRMERAKELLSDPEINIKDISARAGYRDANYFTRVFKRMVGMTPSEFRSGVLGE